MPISRDQLLSDLARALRVRNGEAEADAHVRAIEPWLDVGWPLPARTKREASSPRAAVDAAELAVVDAFPDRAHDLIGALARVSAAAMLAEAIAWESITTSAGSEEMSSPFTRVDSAPVPFENPELGFHRADRAGREALLREITDERAASLMRRRVKLRPGSLEGGVIVVTRLYDGGSTEIPFSSFWLEMTFLGDATQRGGEGDFLVSWIPASRHVAVVRSIAEGGPHAWSEQVTERFDVTAWKPGWVR